MLQEKTLTFDREELCNAAHGNLVSLLLVTIRFMQEQALDADGFWHFVGERYGAGWADVEPGDVDEVALRIARNMLSAGAEVEDYSREGGRARLVLSGWPPAWAVAFLGVPAEEAASICEIFRPITASLGVGYAWEETDGILTLALNAGL